MTSKILHTADIHLCDTHLGRRDRGDDFRNAFAQVVDLAISNKVQGIVLAGDLLNDTRPSPANIQFLFQQNKKLLGARIPMYVVHGDHDKTDPHWASMVRDPSDPTEFGIRVLENELVQVPGTELKVYGLGYIGKANRDAFLEIRDTLPTADILVWHAMVKELVGFPVESAVGLDDLPRNKFQLVALGDIHNYSYERLEDGTVVGYPGSTELKAKSEPLEKSVTLFNFKDGKLMSYEPIPMRTRKALCYNIKTEEDAQDVMLKITKHASENPMVFVNYDPGVEGVVARLHSVLDPTKSIIRAVPVYTNLNENRLGGGEVGLEPKDFLNQWFPVDSELYQVALPLLDAEADASALLDKYIDERLEKLKETI